jgi:undecaprenyl-diphosphatase
VDRPPGREPPLTGGVRPHDAHYASLIDFTLFKALNDLAANHDGLVEDPLRFCALNLQYAFVALLALLFFVRGKWRSVNGRHGVVAAGFSALLALGVAHIIADIWVRPRPYDAHPGAHLFIAPSADSSFPSDHATAAFAIAVALFLRHRKAGWLALAMATLVSVSRVAVGTHYPADVAAGAVIGTVAAHALWQPIFREPLNRLADWAGRIFDRRPSMHEARPRVGRASLEGNSFVDSPGGATAVAAPSR